MRIRLFVFTAVLALVLENLAEAFWHESAGFPVFFSVFTFTYIFWDITLDRWERDKK